METEQRKAVFPGSGRGNANAQGESDAGGEVRTARWGLIKMTLSRMKFMSGSPTRPLSPNSSDPLDEIMLHAFIILLLRK